MLCPVTTGAVPHVDRRRLRRAETIEQIVDVAVEVMAEQGVAGLSLGEVARRIGVRPPSLYVYFSSKNAVYDAVFARGWRRLGEVMDDLGDPPQEPDLAPYALAVAQRFVRWMVQNPVYAQLMSWRPVPGFQPSAEAYEPAVVVYDRSLAVMEQMQERGLLRRDVPAEELLRGWTVLSSGVMTQQLANAPEEPFDSGAFTSLLPQLVAMFLAHHAPPDAPSGGGEDHAHRRRPGR